MVYNRVSILLLLLILLLIIFHLFLFIFVLGGGGRVEYVERAIERVEIREIEAPDELVLIRYLESLRIMYPDIVYAQIMLETGRLTSLVYKENNNLFGMRTVRNRITTSIGSNMGYAVYNNWKESVLDYAIYQLLYLKDKDRVEYLDYLDKVYAEDPDYIKKINLISKEYGKKKKKN